MTDFVATKTIRHGWATAYQPGDPVPEENVKAHGYDKQGLVAKAGTKAADEATEAAGS